MTTYILQLTTPFLSTALLLVAVGAGVRWLIDTFK